MINYDEMDIDDLNKMIIKKLSKEIFRKEPPFDLNDDNKLSTYAEHCRFCEDMTMASDLASYFLSNLESKKR